MLWIYFELKVSFLMRTKKILMLLLFLLAPQICHLYAQGHSLILQSKFETDTLFIQQAATATLRQDPAIPNQYKLTLRGIYPRIIYITNQSKHIAGIIQLSDFLTNWKENEVLFGEDGPSAIMSYLSFKPNIQSGVVTDVLELSHPTYERSSNSIVFVAKPSHNKAVRTGRFKNIVLVFDGLSASSKALKTQYKVLEGPNLTLSP